MSGAGWGWGCDHATADASLGRGTAGRRHPTWHRASTSTFATDSVVAPPRRRACTGCRRGLGAALDPAARTGRQRREPDRGAGTAAARNEPARCVCELAGGRAVGRASRGRARLWRWRRCQSAGRRLGRPMSSRLQLKYGLVSEHDRLSNSADALLVSEPTTGSKARTKGSLYVIVTSRAMGGRSRDACNLIADIIRREYYYDESAGIPIVLQKSIRSANRRLRHTREGGGLAQGVLGLAVAVVRGSELYVATAGDAEAYLVRAARLLMPEREPGPGLPADDSARIDVWRGDFTVGDSLLLCSKNLVDIVGTEELKNAVVTLHPQ